MKINQIIVNETTTAGSVATVAKPMGEMQKRPEVNGLRPIGAKTKKKGPYQNSLSEGNKKDFLGKLQKNIDKSNKQKKDTEEKIKQHQDDKKKVEEAKLEEDDIIVVPGHLGKRKTGFVPRGQSRVDHEVEMARSDVLATMKNAKAIYELLKDRSEEEGIEGWVQEKLIKANDYLNAVKEYYDEKMMQEMAGAGVIAAGGVGENTNKLKGTPVVSLHDLSDKDTKKDKYGRTVTKKLKQDDPRVKFYKEPIEKGVAEGKLNEKFASQQQAKLMHAVAGDKDVAKKTGVSQKVAKEFVKKSHGQKVSELPKKVKKD